MPVENILGERSSTDFGINVGGGVNFQVGETAAIYVEARYHYIWGPEVTDPRTEHHADGERAVLPDHVRRALLTSGRQAGRRDFARQVPRTPRGVTSAGHARRAEGGSVRPRGESKTLKASRVPREYDQRHDEALDNPGGRCRTGSWCSPRLAWRRPRSRSRRRRRRSRRSPSRPLTTRLA